MIGEQVTDMFSSNVIESFCSLWSLPVVLVQKKYNSARLCIDYRELNKITIKYVYPLSRVDVVLDSLSGSTFFSIIDLYKGYWHLPVQEKEKRRSSPPAASFSSVKYHLDLRPRPHHSSG